MIEIKSKIPLVGYLESKIGGRPENQDACSFQETPLGLLIVVCDGMGGMNGGSIASSMAVQSIISEIMEADEADDPVSAITQAVNNANTALLQAGSENPALSGMGTTLTLLLITDKCAYATYVGDSRVYQLRGREKVYRSFDHSVVFQLVRQKVITEEQARLSSQSNVIMQALGVKRDLDFIVEELPYEKGDRFALCTDGFWGSMIEHEIITRLSAKKSIGKIVYESVLEIDGQGSARGGNHDNLTIALIEVQQNSIQKVKMNRKSKIIIAGLAALLVLSLVFSTIVLLNRPSGDVVKLSQEIKEQKKEIEQKDMKIKSLEEAEKNNEETINGLNQKVAELGEALRKANNAEKPNEEDQAGPEQDDSTPEGDNKK